MPDRDIDRAHALLKRLGWDALVEWDALREGGNNRVYAGRSGDVRFVLKCYFQSAADPRDRFGAEKAFYGFCRSRLDGSVPEPLGWDCAERLGLFRRVEGRKLRPNEVSAERVSEAACFIRALNSDPAAAVAHGLPAASEACFSLSAHLACVDRRVARLVAFSPADRLDAEAAAFVRNDLGPAWIAWRAAILRATELDAGTEIPPVGRCVSPSDFGFHNAILAPDGLLRFLDFEYSGWDDPAKLVCDFFCQPELPADASHWDLFVRALDLPEGLGHGLAVRCRLLFPAYRIKWCCILLNEFLRGERERREFAMGNALPQERRQAQLLKAREALQNLSLTGV
jgi:hypothetical protein